MKAKKKRNDEAILAYVSQKIIARSSKWPPDCGGFLFQVKRPHRALSNKSRIDIGLQICDNEHPSKPID